MKLLLKLKHWQLFSLTWKVPILITVFTINDVELSLKLFPLMMLFFAVGTFVWIWAIGTELQKEVPPGVQLKSTKFKILFIMPIVYFAFVLVGLSTLLFRSFAGTGSTLSVFEIAFIFIQLFSMLCILYGIRFAAKTIKTIEMGRKAKFGDYAGEFFLIWFSILGYWFLQPRLHSVTCKRKFNLSL
jgi:hypothetical protein